MKTAKPLIPLQLLGHARAMRHASVSTEHKLWQRPRDRQLGGFKFRRQHPRPPFIADFYCAEAKLSVETDGDSHGDQEQYDASRTLRLMRDGLHVIRFVNEAVHLHLDAVLEELLRECQQLAGTKTPSP